MRPEMIKGEEIKVTGCHTTSECWNTEIERIRIRP